MPDDVPLSAAVREVLDERMKAREVTPYRLSQLTGLQQTSIGRWMRGEAPIKVDDLATIAAALDTSAGYLVTLAEGRATR